MNQLQNNLGESRPLLFIPFSKIDKEKRLVTGIATSEHEDGDGEVLEYDGSKKAVNGWPGNVREMHQLIAAGKAIDVKFDDEKKLVEVTSHISKGAQDTWEKVLDGTLTGYSVKGKVIKREVSASDPKKARVKEWTMDELSLVDRPCNPECTIEVAKAIGGLDQIIEEERRNETMGEKGVMKMEDVEDRLKKMEDAHKELAEAHAAHEKAHKELAEAHGKVDERMKKVEDAHKELAEAYGKIEDRLKKVEVSSKPTGDKDGKDDSGDKEAAQKAAAAAAAGTEGGDKLEGLVKALDGLAKNQESMQKMFGQIQETIAGIAAMKAGGALPQRKYFIDKQYAGASATDGKAAGADGAAATNEMPADIEAIVEKKNKLRQQLTPEETLKLEKYFKKSIGDMPSMQKGVK
jgi:hypothetical protein